MRNHPWLVELGKNLRQAREAKGLSQERLAFSAHLDRTYIGGIERGERNVAAINLIRIAIALDGEVAYFFPKTEALRRLSGGGK